MKKLRIVVIAIAVAFIGYHLYHFNYNDLSWETNKGEYVGILAMICVILSMIFSEHYEKKKGKKEEI